MKMCGKLNLKDMSRLGKKNHIQRGGFNIMYTPWNFFSKMGQRDYRKILRGDIKDDPESGYNYKPLVKFSLKPAGTVLENTSSNAVTRCNKEMLLLDACETSELNS